MRAAVGAAAGPKVVAFYLPQFHPIPENDAWWGAGFTEWHNVARARPLFRGHRQPRLPTELGFYDLRVSEVREAQARLARGAGLDAFCYWHYWFGGGRRLLELPFREVRESGTPDFPFCLAWANERWTGHWKGQDGRLLIEQEYPGEEDDRRHFAALLPAFRDPRYLAVGGRPLFYVYRPRNLPEPRRFVDLWQRLAREAGFPGLHLVAGGWFDTFADGAGDGPARWGFDAVNAMRPAVFGAHPRRERLRRAALRRLGVFANRVDFLRAVSRMHEGVRGGVPNHRTILAGWDTTPRHGSEGWVMTGYGPEALGEHAAGVFADALSDPDGGRVVFVKSWNEWAEGNYLEPDEEWGDRCLRALGSCMARARGGA